MSDKYNIKLLRVSFSINCREVVQDQSLPWLLLWMILSLFTCCLGKYGSRPNPPPPWNYESNQIHPSLTGDIYSHTHFYMLTWNECNNCNSLSLKFVDNFCWNNLSWQRYFPSSFREVLRTISIIKTQLFLLWVKR